MYSVVRVKEKEFLAKNIVRIRFDIEDDVLPGQFYMVWLPGIDEFPLSVAEIGKNSRSFVFKIVGRGTEELGKREPGDRLWIRGPYGNGFKIVENCLIVGGGIGVAPLLPLLSYVRDYVAVFGAKTKDELVILDNDRVIYTTDDGSFGFKGTVVDLSEKLLKSQKFEVVYGCGPEPMLNKLFLLCKEHNVDCQFSLERYMKCGIGLCGSCEIDGYLVCRDGPVFNRDVLERLISFGKWKRNEFGRLSAI